MSGDLILLNILGGGALLLYGMRIAGEGMQSLAGGRLRQMIARLTGHRLLGVLTGAVVTALLQSSSATTVMLVGLVSAGFMSLSQTLGVILGADIGTTLTVQLIAFNILNYAVLLIALGAIMILATRQRQYNYLGQVLLGFGFVFLAMKLIAEPMASLKSSGLFQETLLNLSSAPLVVIVLSGLLTALIHSSAGTIGLAITFAGQGLIPLELAILIILGANIGTSATALLSSVGATKEAQRVAVAHALFKMIGVLIIYPFLGSFVHLVSLTANGLPRQIANAHTLFNLGIGVLFLPFITPFAYLVQKIVPAERHEEGVFKSRYLDPHILDTPALAIGQATREMLRMADIVQSMFRDALVVLEKDDEELLEDVSRRDDQVDFLEKEIKGYLTHLSEGSLTSELSYQEIGLLYIINDLENMGDIIDTSMMAILARKKIEGRLAFSRQGRTEIKDMHSKVSENLELALSAFATRNTELAREVIASKVRINQLERELRQSHIRRLHLGLRESIETSAIHLDLLNDLKRINSHATNIAYVVLGEL